MVPGRNHSCPCHCHLREHDFDFIGQPTERSILVHCRCHCYSQKPKKITYSRVFFILFSISLIFNQIVTAAPTSQQQIAHYYQDDETETGTNSPFNISVHDGAIWKHLGSKWNHTTFTSLSSRDPLIYNKKLELPIKIESNVSFSLIAFTVNRITNDISAINNPSFSCKSDQKTGHTQTELRLNLDNLETDKYLHVFHGESSSVTVYCRPCKYQDLDHCPRAKGDNTGQGTHNCSIVQRNGAFYTQIEALGYPFEISTEITRIIQGKQKEIKISDDQNPKIIVDDRDPYNLKDLRISSPNMRIDLVTNIVEIKTLSALYRKFDETKLILLSLNDNKQGYKSSKNWTTKTISIGETGGESFALIFKPHSSTQELPQILTVSYNRRNDDKLVFNPTYANLKDYLISYQNSDEPSSWIQFCQDSFPFSSCPVIDISCDISQNRIEIVQSPSDPSIYTNCQNISLAFGHDSLSFLPETIIQCTATIMSIYDGVVVRENFEAKVEARPPPTKPSIIQVEKDEEIMTTEAETTTVSFVNDFIETGQEKTNFTVWEWTLVVGFIIIFLLLILGSWLCFIKCRKKRRGSYPSTGYNSTSSEIIASPTLELRKFKRQISR